jgi:hypothetical protein
VATDAAPSEREWLLRALLVLQAPRTVFAALRDDSDDAARARQEPLLALIWLAGVAAVLATPVARRLLDDERVDGLVVAIWAFIGGGFYGALAFWLGGALVYAAARVLGGQGSYRRARHVVGFAFAPLALSLVFVWPVALVAFGGDLFRSGGDDAGTGGALVISAMLAFGVWTLALLAIGIRAVHGWTWGRALATLGLAAAPVAAVAAIAALWSRLPAG